MHFILPNHPRNKQINCKLPNFIFLNIGQNPSKKDVTSETLERNAKPKKLIVHLMI